MRQTSDKFSKVTIRQPTRIKTKIERAAALRGMTVTSFINGSMERIADRTIKRVESHELSARDSAMLLDMLKNPKGPNAALRRAFKEYRARFGESASGASR